MKITVHRARAGVRRIEVEAGDDDEAQQLLRLHESFIHTNALALDGGAHAVRVGPFGGWYKDQVAVIDHFPETAEVGSN